MTSRSSSRRKRTSSPPNSSRNRTLDILTQIQEKIVKSPVLNGGFETLVFKVDGVVAGQEKIEQKVNQVHDAIYEPDEGLFARVRSIETVKPDNVEKIEKDMVELRTLKENEAKELKEADELLKENREKLEATIEDVKDLKNFKNRTYILLKWLLGIMTAILVTLVGELLLDFVTNHIKFV